MKVKSIVSAVVLALAATGAGAVLVGHEPPALAAEVKPLQPKVGKPLQEAQALLKQKNAKEALSRISEAEAASGHSAYETLVINHLKAQAYQQLGDNANLAKAAEAALGTGLLSGSEAATFRSTAAQAYLASGNTAKFAEYAKNDPSLEPLLAQSYLKQGNYAAAESAIRDAISGAGGNAKEEWYLILAEAQRKSGNVTGSADTIQTLLRSHPKPEYWKFVLGNMLNEKGVSDKGRLDIYRLIYATESFSDAEDYTSMAETAIVAKLPGDAKRALDKGFKSGVLGKGSDAGREQRLQATANAKNAEDLKSLPGIEAQAAAQPNGEALASIADSYLSNAQYDKAASLYQSALGKGGLADPAAVKLHLGIAYAGAKQGEKARQTLSAVPGKGLNKQLASLWLVTLH